MKVRERGISAQSIYHTVSRMSKRSRELYHMKTSSRPHRLVHALPIMSLLVRRLGTFSAVLDHRTWNDEQNHYQGWIMLRTKVEYYQNDDNHFLINEVCSTKNLCLKEKLNCFYWCWIGYYSWFWEHLANFGQNAVGLFCVTMPLLIMLW